MRYRLSITRAAARLCLFIGAVLVFGAIAGGAVGSTAASNLGHQYDGLPSVDIELVIAVDVSYSMDIDELVVQREGYAQAIISKEFLQALRTGSEQKIGRDLFRVVRIG